MSCGDAAWGETVHPKKQTWGVVWCGAWLLLGRCLLGLGSPVPRVDTPPARGSPWGRGRWVSLAGSYISHCDDPLLQAWVPGLEPILDCSSLLPWPLPFHRPTALAAPHPVLPCLPTSQKEWVLGDLCPLLPYRGDRVQPGHGLELRPCGRPGGASWTVECSLPQTPSGRPAQACVQRKPILATFACQCP